MLTQINQMTTSEERMAPLTSVPSLKKRCRTGRAWLALSMGERNLEILLVDLYLLDPLLLFPLLSLGNSL